MRLRTRSDDPQLDPRPRALRHSVYATAMLLAPIFLLLGTLLNPAVGGIAAGAANIAVNATADPTANQLHLAFYAVETFLLPVSVLALAGLVLERSPWLATIGGGLGLVGWLPWAALVAQDDLTFQMAQTGGSPQFVDLWNRFTTDATMGPLTLIYVICHLVAYVLLGIAPRAHRRHPDVGGVGARADQPDHGDRVPDTRARASLRRRRLDAHGLDPGGSGRVARPSLRN